MAIGKRARFAASVARAKRIAQRYRGVIGVDFGYVYKAGKKTGAKGIRFHVGQKQPLETIENSQRLPDQIDAFECDVLEAVYKLHSGEARAISGPLAPGSSVGNLLHHVTGSMGVIVTDRYTGARCILSNWHVLAGTPDSAPGEAIVHPGPANLRTSDAPTTIADLMRWTNLSHGYDAAVARLAEGVPASNIDAISKTRIAGAVEAALGMKVVKTGLSSGLTRAAIDGVDGSYQIDYAAFGDTLRWMDGIHLVPDPAAPDDEITLDGDSGAVWYEQATGRAVALNFAGEDGLGPLAEYALAQSITRILSLLEIQMEDA